MLSVDLSFQGYCFLCSLINGAMLGVIYTVFKCIRTALGNRKIPTVICDISYMLIFTAFTYLFSIGFTDGFVRYYVLMGEVLALLAVRFTLGYIIDKLFSYFYAVFCKTFNFLQKNITVFAKKLLKAWDNMLYNIVNKKRLSTNCRKGERHNAAESN